MRIVLDTNVLAYAEGVNGAERQGSALELIARLPGNDVQIPAQALGELFNVLVRKAGRASAVARAAILGWRDSFAIIDTSSSVMMDAAELATVHGLAIWDAVMLAAAADAKGRLLLSEDLPDGFTWRGVTIANPFAGVLHPLLEAAMASRPASG